MTVDRISIDSNYKSSQEVSFEKKIKSLGFDNIFIKSSQDYIIVHDLDETDINLIAKSLHNSTFQSFRINTILDSDFDWILELGFLPGVTDNVATTVREIINDLCKTNLGLNSVFSSKTLFLSGKLSEDDVNFIASELVNLMIGRHHIKSNINYFKDDGMDKITPFVEINSNQKVLNIDLNISDFELKKIGVEGIFDNDLNVRRGPLSLSLNYLKAIRNYFNKLNRNPTDIELESLAQTWSEHCKHTIFASEIDDIKEGLFNKYIKGATKKIREVLGDKDFCVSVFKDNSGAIIFDENYLLTDKTETHNSPSALDPFGGAITGIVGVNRDTVGFGLGALPIANKYGFCLGFPDDKFPIYRSKDKKKSIFSPKRIFEGVVKGVEVGGNCSGIPTHNGFVFFDDSYKGKPLIFVGTVGLIPKKLKDGRLSHLKAALLNDNIVIIGGRTGKDGIHGATFSSENLNEKSPVTAVQIGDPITQKKLVDSVIEARDLGLYNSITDNGAGGFSSSIGEMAKESGGFFVDLKNVFLKYSGLHPWEIWVSESQERMTLSVPDNNLEKFVDLMTRRGVEVNVIGKFTNTGKGIINNGNVEIFNIDLDFLHNGLPSKILKTEPYSYSKIEPVINVENQSFLFKKILSSFNDSSFEFISKQYDHEVMHNSVIKPLQGKGRVNNNVSVIKPLLNGSKGVVISQSIYPHLSEVNCYDMAACSIDTAIRNNVAVGGNVNHLSLMDNFCWSSSNEPKRLFQLKDACKACYDYATIFKTPFISGKDSMFNDFNGFDSENNVLKIKALPTLLISSLSVINDVSKTTTMDFKLVEDLIYVIGKTKNECAGSEFYRLHNFFGINSPKVDAFKARLLYEKIYELHQKELLSSCASIDNSGFLITLAKMSISGQLGLNVDIKNVLNDLSFEKFSYSLTQSRFIITINPINKSIFENLLKNFSFCCIGKVKKNNFIIKNQNCEIINEKVSEITKIYKKRFGNF